MSSDITKKIPAVIQARMGSSRLPGKVLMELGGEPMLNHIVKRLKLARWVSNFIVITSVAKKDNAIVEFCMKRSINCFRGSEKDVLDRYYQVAQAFNMSHLIRITGDNPFIDIEELDRLIEFHFEKGSDYSSNKNDIGTNIPTGAGGAEIFTFNMLEICWKEGKSPHHREHLNPYVLENIEKFNVAITKAPKYKQKKELRLTVDTHEDFERAQTILQLVSKPSHLITTQEIIHLYNRGLIE